MVPICCNFVQSATPSILGSIYDDPQLLYWQQNQADVMMDTSTDLDHHFNFTLIGEDSNYNWHHHPPPQPNLPSNNAHLYDCVGQLNNNIIPSNYYTPTLLPPASVGGGCGQLVFSEEAMAAAEKKRRLDHNASERDRRKRMNSLYNSLRAVLPTINHKKKEVSNPNTVALALRYIPELQNNVQLLFQRNKDLITLLSSTSSKSTNYNTTSTDAKSSYLVQATQLGNGEILVQISTPKSINNIPISKVIRELEEDNINGGLVVMEVSSFQSPAGSLFYHLHLMVEATSQVKCATLREKVLCLCHKTGD